MTDIDISWLGSRPKNITPWVGYKHGMTLRHSEYASQIIRLYRSYVDEWNAVETGTIGGMRAHPGHFLGARVFANNRQAVANRFVLMNDNDRFHGWVLEIRFAQGFARQSLGTSTTLNIPQKSKDILTILLYWKGNGKEMYERWFSTAAV